MATVKPRLRTVQMKKILSGKTPETKGLATYATRFHPPIGEEFKVRILKPRGERSFQAWIYASESVIRLKDRSDTHEGMKKKVKGYLENTPEPILRKFLF